MPYDKFGRTDDKVVQHTPSVSSSIGVKMSQINKIFLRRDESNKVTGDFNMNKQKITYLDEPAAADDAGTWKCVDNSVHAIDTVVRSPCLKRDGSNTLTGNIDMTKHKRMHLGDPVADDDAVTRKYFYQYLKRDGSSQMTSVLNLGRYNVTNVAEPVPARDIATKGYADNNIGLTQIDMNGYKIANLQDPKARSDAVTKGYVDGTLDSIVNVNLNLRGHRINNVANPVDSQDADVMANAETRR